MELIPTQHIDSEIQDSERLVRSVYYPGHLEKKDPTVLNKKAFTPPRGKDELSVLRLEYTDSNFCKQHAQKYANPMNPVMTEYRGLAVVTAKQIRQQKQVPYQADVRSTPLDNLPMHADIFYGYVLQPEVAMPPELSLLIENLTKKAKFYKDSQPKISEWQDGELLPKSET